MNTQYPLQTLTPASNRAMARRIPVLFVSVPLPVRFLARTGIRQIPARLSLNRLRV